MRRRYIVLGAIAVTAVLAAPLAVAAQPTRKPPRIGILF
jgi:hypothetical protein